MFPMSKSDVNRFHTAASIWENGQYTHFRTRFGQDFFGVLAVDKLRRKLNDKPNQWPPPEDLIDKVNAMLPQSILQDADRYHSLVRKLEDDLDEAYFTCRRSFGADLTGVVLVTMLRHKLGPAGGPAAELKVNEFLIEKRLMKS